jgi:uncharacterized Zn-binding protein involved in type VI secretion
MRPVARLGDQGVPHCSGYTIATGSPSVFVNLKPVASVGDISTPHLRPGSPCPGHVASISTGSPGVFVNLRPMARVGDSLAGCTFVATGSSDVFAG